MPGERARLACWLRRLAATNFSYRWLLPAHPHVQLPRVSRKVRAGETPAPTRETRALPRHEESAEYRTVEPCGDGRYLSRGGFAETESRKLHRVSAARTDVGPDFFEALHADTRLVRSGRARVGRRNDFPEPERHSARPRRVDQGHGARPRPHGPRRDHPHLRAG